MWWLVWIGCMAVTITMLVVGVEEWFEQRTFDDSDFASLLRERERMYALGRIVDGDQG